MAVGTYDLEIRNGRPGDEAALLALFDEAVEWLLARGQSGQWGSQRFSANPDSVQLVRRFASGGGLRIAEHGGVPVGALVTGSAPAYVPAADQPESYIHLLLTSRRDAGNGIGTELVRQAIHEARRDGCHRVRVDCWAGAPSLIAWYERNGFTPAGTFDVDGWSGQVFSMDLAEAVGG